MNSFHPNVQKLLLKAIPLDMSFLQTNFYDQDVEEVVEALFDVYPNDITPWFPLFVPK